MRRGFDGSQEKLDMGCRGGGREVQSLHGERLDGDAEEMFTEGRHHLRVLPRTLGFAKQAGRGTLVMPVV